MNICDRFPEGTRKHAICNGTIDMPLEKINRYRVRWGWEPLAEKPETTFFTPEARKVVHAADMPKRYRPNSSQRTTLSDGVGQRLKQKFAEWGSTTCPICDGMAAQLDVWGPEECRRRNREIVADIFSRAPEWFAEHFPKVNGLVELTKTAAVRNLAMRIEIRRLLFQAIRETEAEKKNSRHLSVKSSDPVADVESVVLNRGKRERRNRSVMLKMRSRVDIARCEEARKNRPTEPDPFEGDPIIHFVAHLWPRPGKWLWHMEHWNRVAEQVNGQVLVYVATDSKTDTFEDVQRVASPKMTLKHRRNTAVGESPSFRDALQLIPTGNDDVLIYAHGKGMQDHTAASSAVRLWTELMYETVIHNRNRIIQKLAAGYRSFGSFRAFGRAPLTPKHRWHYAGTFFAIRMKHVTNFHVKQQYGGVEAWPGDQFPPEFAWVEFADCRNIMSHYMESELTTPELLASLEHWRRRHGSVAGTTMNLTEAANKAACDKGTTFSECHGYTQMYQDRIPTTCKMLEIGIGVGASSDMWKMWSPSIEVIYLDIERKCVENERRKGRESYVCDQSSVKALQNISTTIGSESMDVIIDDGSHHPDHQLLTLETLWQCLKPGGQFFIEDLHTSVHYPEEIRAHKRIDDFAKQQGAKLEYFCSDKLARIVKPAT